MSNLYENDEVIQRFREYLKIPSVHPDINYDDCITFLKKQAVELGLPCKVYELVPKKPVLVMTWTGTHPELQTILLNSHMDVVPVYEEQWTHPPFEAHIADGYIYARGTLDMKGVGMAHLEAVRSLKNAGVKLKRTVHISFVPDEEIGSKDGMRTFAESQEFRSLNIGFELDESAPCIIPNTLTCYYGEKTSRQIKITCTGNPVHGALMAPGTAGEKLHYIINKIMNLRAQELKKVQAGTPVGEVISINLTVVEGGVLVNVVPATMSVSFDMRIPPHEDHDEFEKTINTWCKEAGEGVSIEYYTKNPQVKSTKIDGSLEYWNVLVEAVKSLGMTIQPEICPGATDARFVRKQGIPAINFTPFDNTSLGLLHSHDERIHVDIYKKGIKIIEKVVQAVANV